MLEPVLQPDKSKDINILKEPILHFEHSQDKQNDVFKNSSGSDKNQSIATEIKVVDGVGVEYSSTYSSTLIKKTYISIVDESKISTFNMTMSSSKNNQKLKKQSRTLKSKRKFEKTPFKNKSEKNICKTGENVKKNLFNLILSENETTFPDKSDSINIDELEPEKTVGLLISEENNLSEKNKLSEIETNPIHEESDTEDFNNFYKPKIFLISEEELVDWKKFVLQIKSELWTAPEVMTECLPAEECIKNHPSINCKFFLFVYHKFLKKLFPTLGYEVRVYLSD